MELKHPTSYNVDYYSGVLIVPSGIETGKGDVAKGRLDEY